LLDQAGRDTAQAARLNQAMHLVEEVGQPLDLVDH
jgi:hypothetical protein